MKILLRLITFLSSFLILSAWPTYAAAPNKGSKNILSVGGGYSSRIKLQSSRKDLYEGLTPIVGMYFGKAIKWGFVFQTTPYTANYTEINPYTETISLYGLALRFDLANNGAVFLETQGLYSSNSSYGGAIAGVFRIPLGVGSKIGVFGKYQILTGASGAEYGFTPGLTLELDL